jgi:hypothetical protein
MHTATQLVSILCLGLIVACDGGTCRPLCRVQADCPEGTYCDTSDGKCEEITGDTRPVITDVTGNHPTAPGLVVDGIRVVGQTLAAASFELREGAAASPLVVRSQTDTLVELVLPTDVVSGNKTLVATNSAGSDQASVTLTLPELDGDTLLGRINSDATGVLVIARLPVGTTGTTVARGDHNHDVLTPAALASQEFYDAVGDATAELVDHRAWVTSGSVIADANLEINVGRDATAATAWVWRQTLDGWTAVDAVTVPPLIDDASLHAFYELEETSGTVLADSSGAARSLGLGDNFQLGVPGVTGKALFFGGNSVTTGGQATSVSFGLTLGNELTLAAWIFPHIVNTDIHWLTLNEDASSHAIYFSFYPTSCNADRLSLRGDNSGSQCSERTLRAREWTHVAAVYNQATQTVDVYINGRLDVHHTGQALTYAGVTMNFFRLGERFSGHGYDFIGRMDDVAVFSRALSATEIYRLATAGARFGGYQIERTAGGVVRVINRSRETQSLRMMVVF